MGSERVRITWPITCKSTNTRQIESTYKQNLKLTTSEETELTPQYSPCQNESAESRFSKT